MPARSDLRVGPPAEVVDAHTRSHLPDGRVVGWYGAPGVVIDAEDATAAPPAALVARFGAEDFWGRWTRAECAAKLAGVPMQLWLGRHGLDPVGALVETVRLGDLVVSIGRR